MKVATVKPTRNYMMRARAESTSKTREQILDAVVALYEEKLSLEIVLDDVAGRAGVSVQTVLRHFSSRRRLFEHAHVRQVAQVRTELATPVADVASAVSTIVAFYDRRGEGLLRLQAQEHSDELSRHTAELIRSAHREWVEKVFAPKIVVGRLRGELMDPLVVATNVLTWKSLRRDCGMDSSTTCQRMLRPGGGYPAQALKAVVTRQGTVVSWDGGRAMSNRCSRHRGRTAAAWSSSV